MCAVTQSSSSSVGTGAVDSLFLLFPYWAGSKVMLIFGEIFFCLNLLAFLFFLIFTITKYTMYPGAWYWLLRNPITALYIGCCPMGAATLLTVGVTLFHDEFGIKGALPFLWALWWIDVGISFMCCFMGLHIMYVLKSIHFD